MNKTYLSVAISAALLAGCAVGPDYQRPALELPATVGNALVAGPAQAGQPWWKVFRDPALDKLIEEAVAHNTDILTAAARVTEAEAQLGIARSDQFPTFYATAGRTRAHSSQDAPLFQPGLPLDTIDNKGAINVSFDLDFWGQYRRATEAARADLMASEAHRDTVRLTLESGVAEAYIGLLALDAQLAAGQLALQRAKEAFEMQKVRFSAGVSSEFEFRQREAEYDADLAQLPPIESARAKQERALLILLGRSPKGVTEDKIERVSTLSVPAMLSAGLPSELLLNRPDVREAEQKLIAANARIGVARAAFFPSISLTGFLGSESSSLSDLFKGPARAWNFAGNLTQPLWGAGRVTAGAGAAEARNEQAVQAYRATVANAFREVADALSEYAKARAVAEANTRRVASLTKTWELAKLRFTQGVSSQLDVIDAERGLLMAELDRITAERDQRLAVADFYRALGGRTASGT